MNTNNELIKRNHPSNIQEYYTRMHDRAIYRVDKVRDELEEKRIQCIALKEEIKSKADIYKDKYKIDLMKYSEFRNNTFTSGEFRRAAMLVYMNRKENHTLVLELYNLVKLVNLQKRVLELERQFRIYRVLSTISFTDYRKVVTTYYNKVQEFLLDGKGYAFTGRMGWICINRYKKTTTKNRVLDYEATRKAKEKLIAEGKKPYDAEEAKWCKEHGIPYNGVKYAVVSSREYEYEIPLIESHIPGGKSFKRVTSSDYINTKLRGKNYDEMIELCHHDIEEIKHLDVDVKKKLEMCLRVNPLLYTKFIRHESQKSYRRIKIDW